MDYLPGGSLVDQVKRNGPLSEDKAEKYIRQVADALNYIHSQNTVHLDVKPSNILLNAKGEAILIDFGISKHYDDSGDIRISWNTIDKLTMDILWEPEAPSRKSSQSLASQKFRAEGIRKILKGVD